MTPRSIAKKYRPRIAEVLRRVSGALENEGYAVDWLGGTSGDEYGWALLVHPRWEREHEEVTGDHIDVVLRIAESKGHDGSEGGMSFAMDISEVDGAIVGEMIPENFTENVWVRMSDPRAVEARFRLFERPGIPSEVADLIVRHHDRRKPVSPKDWCPRPVGGTVPPPEEE